MICEVCGTLVEDCECEDEEETMNPIFDDDDWFHDPDMGDQ